MVSSQINALRWGRVSHHDTYVIPEKTSITKGCCNADLAASDAPAQNGAGTCSKVWHKSDTAGSASVHGAKENPGERAGSTGAKQIEQGFKGKEYIRDHETATALCHAILACDRADAFLGYVGGAR